MKAKTMPEKKPYTPPTLVRHGSAVEQTRGGVVSGLAEFWGSQRIHNGG
jgi:hypothetical protein